MCMGAQAQTVDQGYTGLRPLQSGEFRVNPDGSHSTELTRTMPSPDGQWMNAPSLWMGPGGPVELESEDDVRRRALDYERGTGQQFPRAPTLEEAVAEAIRRSKTGGVTSGPLAR